MRKMFVSGLITLGAGTAALGAYLLVYRPWQEHWGATEEEITWLIFGKEAEHHESA